MVVVGSRFACGLFALRFLETRRPPYFPVILDRGPGGSSAVDGLWTHAFPLSFSGQAFPALAHLLCVGISPGQVC